jgi:hypothetical protein
VKLSDLGEHEENARGKQNIQYTRKHTSSPSNQGKSQAPPVIPRSEKEGTKAPYVCPGCSNHTHGNNMINRCNVIK